jgi:hypothetical protein
LTTPACLEPDDNVVDDEVVTGFPGRVGRGRNVENVLLCEHARLDKQGMSVPQRRLRIHSPPARPHLYSARNVHTVDLDNIVPTRNAERIELQDAEFRTIYRRTTEGKVLEVTDERSL